MPSATHSTPDTLSDADDAPRPFAGHTERITAIEYSPDGHLLATASEDATIRLWDPLTGQQLQKLDTPGEATSLAFHPTGRQLATICENDSTVLVWNVTEGGSGVLHGPLRGHLWGARLLCFSRDGEWLVDVSGADTVCVWDTSTGKLALGHTKAVTAIEYSPDGRLIATASEDTTVCLWDPFTGQQLQKVDTHRHTKEITAIKYSPDGRLIATASEDATVRLWDSMTGQQLQKLYTPSGAEITAIEYSPDGRLIATASEDATVRLWDPTTGQHLQNINTPCGAKSLAFSPSGKQLAAVCEDTTVLIWRVDDGKILHSSLRGHLWRTGILCFSRDGGWLIDVSKANAVCVWDTSTGNMVVDGPPRPFAGHTNKITAIEYSPDGQLIATASEDATVRLWYSRTGQLLQKIETHLPAHSLTFSPSGSQLATICANGAAADPPVANLWEAYGGKVLQGPLRGHLWGTSFLCFSRDGRWLIDVSRANTVSIWDTSTGNMVLGPLRQPPNLGIKTTHRITSATCSPLKDRVACADDAGHIHVWDVDTEQVLLSSVCVSLVSCIFRQVDRDLSPHSFQTRHRPNR
ncbi:WD40 repeat-like protein [Coniophora puteana RWD-64-598 SS2]|uniref:WD40 repeat-like protein n=1 Tax=Coniophora puteana (strain RWD-64-598) TaxID=741705 RepID=A0A5M3MDM1_CONPW|nr:WD40 repeat-like protein [Coniophora puteana RWD-64-598 SS2]EIW77362.1 WD40 repeat-like protein [Coniophora puteana RWD-64-598 SS2]